MKCGEKMDWSLLQSLLGTVGFPIICCVFLYDYIRKKDEQIMEILEKHKSEVDGLKSSLDKNTEVMEKILLKME